MTNISELVQTLTQKGVELKINQDKLRVHSPKGKITPELRAELVERKSEILEFLRHQNNSKNLDSERNGKDFSLRTIGQLIGGVSGISAMEYNTPIVDPKTMASKLKVTFRPLPENYSNKTIESFREQLKLKLEEAGVHIESWEEATREFDYEVKIPLVNLKKVINTRIIRSDISAVIDVERHPSLVEKMKMSIAEKLYQIYSHFILKGRQIPVSKIAQFIGWAEANIKAMEDPTNTQAIVLADIDKKFADSTIPYQQKIPIGINTMVRTFSEIVIGVSETQISILNMNLSDSIFPVEGIDNFVLKSLIPKIYVPILPIPMSRFEISEYNPHESTYATKLVNFGNQLASTGLLPKGFKVNDVIKRKSHRDIVDSMMQERTGVSYGFVAYAEPPQYVGAPEITEREWNSLLSAEGFSRDELRQNEKGRLYTQIKIGDEVVFKQIPDIWLVSSRSGSTKTDLNLEKDILRAGLSKGKLLLQLPQGIDLATSDIKPSYDIYVMVAMVLTAALYMPDFLKEDGAPMMHFHGYPSRKWFQDNEYFTGSSNPSVPCGTYESGVFNFLGMQSLAKQVDENVNLIGLVEPDHGTNIMACNLDYLMTRLHTGVEQGQIELGGRHFPSLQEDKVPLQD